MARWVWFSVLILFVAGCSSTGIPRATPTVAPTDTPEQGTPIVQAPSRTPMITGTSTTAPTRTATMTFTVTALPSESNTSSPAPTDTPTDTATRRPTALPLIGEPTDTPMPTSTDTPIPSDTPTPTATQTPTATVTDAPTNTPTVTPSPLPTNTPNPTATDTPLPTTTDALTPALPPTLSVEQIRATVSARQTANAPTATPTFNLTQIAEAVFATETAFPPTATARAAQTATAQTATAPTLDATPTFVTATPGVPPFTLTPITDLGIVTPVIVGQSTTAEFSEIVTPVPTSTFVFPTVPPVLAPPTLSSNWQEQIITRTFTNIGTQSYTVGAVIPLAQGSVGYGIGANGDILPQLFARNPANANSYVRTNTNGTFYVSNNGQEYIPAEPFSPYVGTVGSPAQNDYFVSAVAWSANGRYVAFVVDGDRGGHPSPTGEDGVHYLDLETGGVVTVVRDCPYEGHPGCQLGGGRDFHAQTTDVTWSPGSTRMLVRQRITDGWAAGTDRGALLIVPLDQPSEQQPVTLRYDYGAWTNDGRRVVVSGQSPNNGVIIGTVNPDNTDLQVILDGSSMRLWIQNAVQRPDGSFVALGRPAGESAVRIIDQSGNFLTAPIGTGAPQSVTWNSDRSAVSVIAGGRQYIAYLDGRVNEVLLGSEVPGGSAPLPAEEQAALVPSGVVEGSRFGPGDQAQVQSEQLNIRIQPGVNAVFVGVYLQRGEYVRVLAGPVSVDGYEWWQVTTADGRLGWVAGNIGGFQTLAGT